MKRTIMWAFVAVAASVAIVVGSVAGFSPTARAQESHHNFYQAVYVTNNSIAPVTFSDDVGATFKRYHGGSACCFKNPGFRVDAGYDIIVTSREKPRWVERYTGTGWYAVPKLASPGHTYYYVVPN